MKKQLIIWTMLCIVPLFGMAVDLVAPSLPHIVTDLHTTASLTKNTIAIYLLGYALGNFFTGFLTDAYGRKILLRGALLAFALFSLIPVFFPNIYLLLMARLLQGLALGAVAVVARASMSDVATPEELVKLGPWNAAMWGIGPIIGPVIGGYLQYYIGWQAGFVFFSILGFILFLIVFALIPETHQYKKPLSRKTIKLNLRAVFSNRLFMSLIIMMGITYALIIIFNTSAPFLIQNVMHNTPIFFGHMALLLGVVFLIAPICCRIILKKLGVDKLLLVVINVFFGVAILLTVISYAFTLNLVFIMIASAVMFSSCGFIFPMCMGKGLSLFRHIAGTATAVMYLVNVLLTSIVSFVVSYIHIKSSVELMWLYLALFALMFLVYWGMTRRSKI